MNELKRIIETNYQVKRIIDFWSKKILLDKEYKGIEANELSKYYEIKTATKVVIDSYLLDNPNEKITSYKSRKIALTIASMIIDESKKIEELTNELYNY